ncbi:uncharacterized protein LOC144863338 [Branchiostoma floridae x Branchiostoma japonicum]
MADAVDVVRCLLCSSGMAANLLIVSIVARYPAMRTACNVYVANLAVADFSFCLLALIQSIIAIQSTNSEALYLQLLEDFCSNVWNEVNSTVTTRNVTNHTGSYMIGENCTGQLERVTIFDAYCFEDELNSTSTTRNGTSYTDTNVMTENCTSLVYALYPSAAMFPSLQKAGMDSTSLSWAFERSCDVSRLFVVFLAATSIILLTVIAVERYRAITNPLSSRQHGTVQNAGRTCAIVWMAAVLAAVIDTIARNVVANDWTFTSASLHSGASCVILRLESSDISHPFFVLILLDFLFGYVLPSCIIIPLYARILLKVRQSSRLTVRKTRSDHQAFLMVFVVTVVFLINWLPFHIISLLIHMFVAREKYDTIGVALSFAVLNSVANPFLYALLGRNFRDKVKKMLCCKQWWWKSKRWIPKGEASPETTLTIHAIDTTGNDNDQSLATGGAKEGHATGGTGQARATWTMQAQATDRTKQTQAKGGTGQVQATGGTGQVQATDETEQTQPADRTEQDQVTGGTGQTQATGGAGQAQATDGAGQAHTTGGTEQAQASGGTGQAQPTDRTEQPQSTGGTEQARITGGTEQAQATGGTGQVQPTDRKEQAQATGGTG